MRSSHSYLSSESNSIFRLRWSVRSSLGLDLVYLKATASPLRSRYSLPNALLLVSSLDSDIPQRRRTVSFPIWKAEFQQPLERMGDGLGQQMSHWAC
jgi:hypothetical protein